MNPKMRRGARVIVRRPRKFQGGTGPWKDRIAVLKFVPRSQRYVHLVFEGETDQLWFFADEFDILD